MRNAKQTTWGVVLAVVLSACGGGMTVDAGVTVNAPAGLTYTPSGLVCTVGTACALLGPSNSGGAVATFSIAPALPTGLSLDAATGAISGIATTATAMGSWVVTGTNAGGSASVILSITVKDAAPASLSYSADPAIYVKGTAITPNTPNTRGGAVESWSVTPALPVGLSLSASTGVISGTPSVVAATASYTVTATNSGGSTTVSLTLTVNDVAPSALTYATSPLVTTLGQAVTPDAPSNTGGAIVSYQVSPALPAGLTLDPTTGIISGTPTALTAAATHTITGTNSGGSTTAMVSVSVLAVAPSSLIYATNPANYTLNVAITANAPSSSGGAVTGFTVMPALPTGLALDAMSGVISGTPTVLSTSAVYVVTASNSGGSTSAMLTVSVRPAAPTFTTSPASQTVQLGTQARFTYAATGTGTLTAQWNRGGMSLMGATGTSYVTGPLVAGDNGAQFTVSVSDTYGSTVTSAPATLTVTPATFTSTGSMSSPRVLNSTTRLSDGRVLVVGGYAGVPGFLSSVERYDPTSGQWTATMPMSAARALHAATLLQNGKVLVSGGTNGATTNTAELFDPTAGTFSPTANTMSVARRDAPAVLLNNGKVLIVGGSDQNYSAMPPIFVNHATAELYDPTTSRFTATGSLSVARGYPTATLLADGKVLVVAGTLSGPASAEVYDPSTGGFTPTIGAPSTARMLHAAVLLPSGKVLVVGGSVNSTGVTSAELYDPSTGRFTATTSPMNDARIKPSVTLLPSGKVLIAGGSESSSTTAMLSTAELYDPVTNTFVRAGGAMASPRGWHGAALLNDGKTLLVGGYSSVPLNPVVEASAELFW